MGPRASSPRRARLVSPHALYSPTMAWDGEEERLERDEETGAWIAIAIHSTPLGPAVGGTRMKSYASADEAAADARRLSAAMTLKGEPRTMTAPSFCLQPRDRVQYH